MSNLKEEESCRVLREFGIHSGKHSWIDEESSKGVRLLCLACVAATSDCGCL